jgi:hypothetical protein
MQMRPAVIRFLLILVSIMPALAQPPGAMMLNGWLLGQTKETAAAAFGKPSLEKKVDDQIVRTYAMPGSPRSSMTFTFPLDGAPSADVRVVYDESNRSTGLKITGTKATPMLPFYGLKLGASEDDVTKVFGKPSTVHLLEDSKGNDTEVEVWEYEARNYSFELDPKEGLISIELSGTLGTPNPPEWPGAMTWEHVLGELRSNDENRWVALFDPEIKFWYYPEDVKILDSMQRSFHDPKSPIRKALAATLAALAKTTTPPTLTRGPGDPAKGDPADAKYKFAADSPLFQIVMYPDDDAWRIKDIWFRGERSPEKR